MKINDNVMMLWPTPVGVFYNSHHNKIKKELINFFEKYKANNPNSRKAYENMKLYESAYNIHTLNNSSYNELMYFIANCFGKIAKAANKNHHDAKNSNYNVNIKESWFIIYESSGFVAPHIHGNCSWSCVYYIQCDAKSGYRNGGTYLQKPSINRLKHDSGSKYLEFGTHNFEPLEGKLVVWPSHIVHGSFPYVGKKKRIIVSANGTIQINRK